MRDKKLTIVIPRKLPSSKELLGFKLCFPSHGSTRSPHFMLALFLEWLSQLTLNLLFTLPPPQSRSPIFLIVLPWFLNHSSQLSHAQLNIFFSLSQPHFSLCSFLFALPHFFRCHNFFSPLTACSSLHNLQNGLSNILHHVSFAHCLKKMSFLRPTISHTRATKKYLLKRGKHVLQK